MIRVTETAQAYLQKLALKPEYQHQELLLTVVDPDTPYAEAGLSFVTIGPEHADDLMAGIGDLRIFIDHQYKHELRDAVIDLQGEGLNTELHIDTPNLKPMHFIDNDAPVEDKIIFYLQNEINPGLAMHGGHVRLKHLTDDYVAMLEFSGGCQGCAQIDVTLKQGIESTLKKHIPELKGICDITDHASGTMPYF